MKKKTIIFFRRTKKKTIILILKKYTHRNGIVHVVAIFFIIVYICNLNFNSPFIIIYLSQNNNVGRKATLYLNNYLIYMNFVVKFTQSKQECI